MSVEDLNYVSKRRSKGGNTPIQDDVLEFDDQLATNGDESISEASEASRRLFRDEIASIAVASVTGPERRHQLTKVEDIIARRKLEVAKGDISKYRHNDPYAELGGGVPSKNPEEPGLPLENVLNDKYEPWQTDIKAAVEQFGLVDYTVDELREMRPIDYQLFCLHFYAYLQNIEAGIRLIDGVDDEGTIDARLRERYGRQTPEAFKKYRQTLDWLKQDLEETGLPNSARTTLGVTNSVFMAKRRIALLELAQRDRRRHRHDRGVRVVSKKGKLGIERAKD